MPTARKTILAAPHARLSALAATALRGEVLPERVPAEGLLILRDGEPGESNVTLSPLCYHYQHRAEIKVVVQGAGRDSAFDTLNASIGAAITADRTLGGLCDWIEVKAPRPVDLPVKGAASLGAHCQVGLLGQPGQQPFPAIACQHRAAVSADFSRSLTATRALPLADPHGRRHRNPDPYLGDAFHVPALGIFCLGLLCRRRSCAGAGLPCARSAPDDAVSSGPVVRAQVGRLAWPFR